MKSTKKRFCVTAFIILFMGCVPKVSEDTARAYLEPILQDALTVLVDGIDSSAILEVPRFEITEFTKFDKGEYQYLAVADFYFFKNIRQKIVRKYRFHHIRKWELYYNEYQSY